MIEKAKVLSTILFSTILFASTLYAQQVVEERDGSIRVELNEHQNSNLMAFKDQSHLFNFDDYYTLDPMFKWGHNIEFDNPEYVGSGTGREKAGDLDGDGIVDLIHRTSTYDYRTSDLSDFTNKTFIYLSSGDFVTPDIVLYDWVFPVGDIQGTGRTQLLSNPTEDGFNLYEINQDASFDVSNIQFSVLNQNYIPGAIDSRFLDIDANGYDDLVYTSINDITVVFNNTDLANSTRIEYNFVDSLLESEKGFSYPQNVTFHVSRKFDNKTYFYFSYDARDENNFKTYYILIFSIDEAKEFKIEQVLEVNGAQSIDDLQIVRLADNYLPALSSNIRTDIGYSTILYTESNADSLLYDVSPKELSAFDARVIGDLNNDGTDEFAFREGAEFKYGVLNEDTTIISGGRIRVENDTSAWTWLDFPRHLEPLGDLNGDDIDDALLWVSKKFSAGFVHIYGVEEGNSVNITSPDEFLFQFSDKSLINTERSFGVGDITGDGLDDFAFYITDIIDGDRLEFYRGGNLEEATPYFSIPMEKQIPVFVTAGNFTEEENRDIVILMNITNEFGGPTKDEVHFYKAESSTPFNIITAQDYRPELNINGLFLGTIANAGDVNADGYDDLLVAAPGRGNYPIGLYFGGTELSTNPDDEISFSKENGFVYTGNWGGTMQGGYDLNGDDIDDFIVANVGELNANEIDISSPITNEGVVHIYYGRQGAVDFTDSDLKLRSDTSAINKDINYWLFGMNEIAVGDFSGDGADDVAVKPFRHYEYNDLSIGKDAIHIFHGGEDFDGQPDQLIPLLKEVHQPDNEGNGNKYTSYSSRALLSSVPDVNGDGADELVYIGPAYERNGSLFFGGESMGEDPNAVLKAPNGRVSFNLNQGAINRQYRMTIGEFTEEGVTSIIVEQPGDINFRDTPAYLFELTQTAVSNEERVASSIPKTFNLEQNYPNPFNPTTNIQFTIPQASDVKLTVYNVLGQQVMTVVNEFRQAGTHTAIVDAQNLSSGMYIYRLDAGSVQLNRKMMLIK